MTAKAGRPRIRQGASRAFLLLSAAVLAVMIGRMVYHYVLFQGTVLSFLFAF